MASKPHKNSFVLFASIYYLGWLQEKMSAFFLEEAHPRYDAFTNYCKSCLLFAFPKMLQCHPQHFREAVCKDYRKEAMTESHVGLKGRQAEEWEIRIPLVCWYLNPPHVWVPQLCCWALFHTILKKIKVLLWIVRECRGLRACKIVIHFTF